MKEELNETIENLEEGAKQPVEVKTNTYKGLIIGAAIVGALVLTTLGVKFGKKFVAKRKAAKAAKEENEEVIEEEK